MKLSALILAGTLAMTTGTAGTATAYAKVKHHRPVRVHRVHRVHRVQPSQPPTTDVVLTSAESAAVANDGNPSCGTPLVQVAPTMPQYAAVAYVSECRIQIDPTIVQMGTQSGLDYLYVASVMTHEYEHLVLGVTFFTSNPADPAHSADPRNIMWGGPLCSPLIVTPSVIASLPSGLGKASYRSGRCTVSIVNGSESQPCVMSDSIAP